MDRDCLLTTKDNPYDPFTQFREWYIYDETNGYHTCGLIARLDPYDTSELSPGEINRNLETIYDRILKNVDFQGIYKKVYREKTTL